MRGSLLLLCSAPLLESFHLHSRIALLNALRVNPSDTATSTDSTYTDAAVPLNTSNSPSKWTAALVVTPNLADNATAGNAVYASVRDVAFARDDVRRQLQSAIDALERRTNTLCMQLRADLVESIQRDSESKVLLVDASQARMLKVDAALSRFESDRVKEYDRLDKLISSGDAQVKELAANTTSQFQSVMDRLTGIQQDILRSEKDMDERFAQFDVGRLDESIRGSVEAASASAADQVRRVANRVLEVETSVSGFAAQLVSLQSTVDELMRNASEQSESLVRAVAVGYNLTESSLARLSTATAASISGLEARVARDMNTSKSDILQLTNAIQALAMDVDEGAERVEERQQQALDELAKVAEFTRANLTAIDQRLQRVDRSVASTGVDAQRNISALRVEVGSMLDELVASTASRVSALSAQIDQSGADGVQRVLLVRRELSEELGRQGEVVERSMEELARSMRADVKRARGDVMLAVEGLAKGVRELDRGVEARVESVLRQRSLAARLQRLLLRLSAGGRGLFAAIRRAAGGCWRRTVATVAQCALRLGLRGGNAGVLQ